MIPVCLIYGWALAVGAIKGLVFFVTRNPSISQIPPPEAYLPSALEAILGGCLVVVTSVLALLYVYYTTKTVHRLAEHFPLQELEQEQDPRHVRDDTHMARHVIRLVLFFAVDLVVVPMSHLAAMVFGQLAGVMMLGALTDDDALKMALAMSLACVIALADLLYIYYAKKTRHRLAKHFALKDTGGWQEGDGDDYDDSDDTGVDVI